MTTRALHVASELYPLLKTGGLADVVGALPPALIERGADVRVLLPGFPNPVRLSLTVDVDSGALPLRDFRSSLHAVVEENREGVRNIRLKPGERLDRDFILRFR